MKKIIAMSLLLLFATPVFADEVTPEVTDVNQEIDVENAGVVSVITKQPIYGRQIQVIRVRKSGVVSVITINGKAHLPKPAKETKEK